MHVSSLRAAAKTWMPATSAGMTNHLVHNERAKLAAVWLNTPATADSGQNDGETRRMPALDFPCHRN
jgi:hypothetical protein